MNILFLLLVSILPIALGALSSSSDASSPRAPKVPIEIHIMSKCPDATYCATNLITPALPFVSDISTFQLSFIGEPTSDGGVSCKHGPSECRGNMLHLCGAEVSSPPSPPPVERYWPFSVCLLSDYNKVDDEVFVRNCAEAAGISFDAINNCLSDFGENGGLELLRKSMLRSKKEGATTSCTVRVAGHTVCVRDGGEWKDCEGGSSVQDLVRQVREEYEKGGGKGGKGLRLNEQFADWREDSRIVWTMK